ncbi:PQQ-dependent sugar dehydrogenase [Acidaminobacter sp. JC074]|uniref:PQQ-dependent sugar dehydrogenase n=1 Tax=Acidaminobacter sp. JC074 TaxID=2530199 RepID=UPI001F0D10E6|nr:PQQ-dependent sugar dehydrogenase [Acidaminobacter sp. JC074]MCH4891379.1 PQQ-dependent sugar dehydrogenase [Acidaminobacter sp. JC074]
MNKIKYFVIIVIFALVSCSSPNESLTSQGENISEPTNEIQEENSPIEEANNTTVEEVDQVEEVEEVIVEKTEQEKLYERGFNPATYKLVKVFDTVDFVTPLHLTSQGEEVDYVYIVQKNGLVLKVNVNDGSQMTFLDVKSLIDVSKQEKGLLGFAFHPSYPLDPRIFISYTNKTDSVVASLEVKEGIVDMDSHLELLSFKQPFSNHNGGHLEFGPDGYLYIASGDGGSGGDPQNNAQDLSNLLGKILRINVEENGYSIPEDNPFIGTEGARQEIFAYGLRNPWKFSFDKVRNLLLAADVGQDAVEEIDIIVSGGNYGWSIYEGTKVYKNLEFAGDLIPPVWEYEHPIGKSITGGFTYYGDKLDALYGVYIYGDFISGKIWGLWLDEKQEVTVQELLETQLKIASFGRDEKGEIYVIDYTGHIYKIVEEE